jgi:hypothetical protein
VNLKLRHDPLKVFEGSTTPAGLYARKKWLGQAGASFQRDFDAAVARISAGQSPEGLWNGSAQETIRRLFGLHLTVRNITPAIAKSLDRLADDYRYYLSMCNC